MYDEENSQLEDRYDTIGDLSAGYVHMPVQKETAIGNRKIFSGKMNDIIFAVYTERVQVESFGKKVDITGLISARFATNFERGLYYGKY